MQFFDTFLACYGWEGAALAGAMLLMLGVQLYYYLGVFGRIAGYRNNRFFWSRQKPPLESLASQSVETPEELLPGFASGDFAPKIRLPSLPVPEVKEILPTCIGAERKTEGGTGKAAGRQHAGILKKVFPGNDIWNGKQGVAL